MSTGFTCFPRQVMAATAGALCVAAVSTAAMAQNTGVIEEITVSAQRRTTTLMETPAAISAFDQATLNRNGIQKAEDLTMLVPNFKFGDLNLGFGGAQFTIRGISNDAITNDGDPSIAVYLDDVYLPRISSGNALLYDLDRVEVLRGPQGTLYGRNTTSGAIKVIPKRPSNEAEIGAWAEVGSDQRYELRGVVNLPFIDEKFAMRVAGYYAKRDGLRTNFPADDGDDIDEWGARASLLWNATENLSLLFTADWFKQSPNGTVMASVPYDRSFDLTGFQYPFTTKDSFPLNIPAQTGNDDTGAKFELNWDAGWGTLTWINGIRGNVRSGTVDRDGTDVIPLASDLCRFSGPFTAGCIAGDMTSVGNFAVTDVQSDSISSELRLKSSDDSDSRFSWLLGLYYFEEDQDTDFDAFLEGLRGVGFIAPDLGAPPPLLAAQPAVRINRFTDQHQESFAVFGEGGVTFGSQDQFKITAGVRYTDDEKDDGDNSYVGFTLDPLTGPPAIDPGSFVDGSMTASGFSTCTGGGGSITIFRCQLRTQEGSWDETTWKVSLDWRPSDDWLGYISAGTGYRAGGFNDANEYQPEELTAYEIGTKGTLLDGKAQLIVDLFYYDFQDQQVSQVVSAQIVTRNAAESTLFGGEVVYNWQPTERVRLDVSLAYLDAEYDKFPNVDDPQTPGIVPEDLSGNKLPKAPEWSVNIGLEPWIFNFGQGATLTPRINFHWEDESFMLPFNNPQNKVDSWTRTDLRLIYETGDGRWLVQAWVKNLEDDDDIIGAQFTTPNSQLVPPNAPFIGLPPGPGREELLLGSLLPSRTFGLSAGFKF